MVYRIAEDQGDQKILDNIAKFGWHCVHISAEDEQVGYSFTVGLFQTYGHPELVIFGLPSNVAHQILVIAANAAKSGAPLDLTQPCEALLNDFSCCFVEVPRSNYYDYVGIARWYYEGNEFPLYQIVWPSRDGLFPWHHRATPEFRLAQPVIAQAPGGT